VKLPETTFDVGSTVTSSSSKEQSNSAAAGAENPEIRFNHYATDANCQTYVDFKSYNIAGRMCNF